MSVDPAEGEQDTIPSRFSIKPRRSTATVENTAPSPTSPPPQTFVDLGVSSSLVAAMGKISIRMPTEVQIACIPPLLDGMCSPYLPSPSHAEEFGKVGTA